MKEAEPNNKVLLGMSGGTDSSVAALLLQDAGYEVTGITFRFYEKGNGHVRTEVSKKMHIRKAPRFIFVEDDGAAYAAHINELLRTLNVNGDADTEASAPEETEE